MNPDPIRWVVMKGPGGEYQTFSGPLSVLEGKEIPEQEQLGFTRMALVDTEDEAREWLETYKVMRLT